MTTSKTYWANRSSAIDAQYTAQYYSPEQKRRDIALHFLQREAASSVVDVGCGTGAFLSAAGALGVKTLYGCDLSPEMLEVSQRKIEEAKLQAGFFVWDLNTLLETWEGTPCDVLTCFSVLPYVKDWTRFIEALPKLIKPNGLVMISCPNRLFDAYTLNDMTKNMYQEVLGQVDLAPCNELEALLDSAPNFKKDSAYSSSDTFLRLAPSDLETRLFPYGLKVVETFYMNYHPVPPRFEHHYDPDLLAAAKEQKEKNILQKEWSDILTHSTFLTVFRYDPSQ